MILRIYYSIQNNIESAKRLSKIQNLCRYTKSRNDVHHTTLLHFAAKKGHLKVCQLIASNITDKNPKNSIGETPIQLAFDSGHSTIVKMLQAGLSKKIKLG